MHFTTEAFRFLDFNNLDYIFYRGFYLSIDLEHKELFKIFFRNKSELINKLFLEYYTHDCLTDETKLYELYMGIAKEVFGSKKGPSSFTWEDSVEFLKSGLTDEQFQKLVDNLTYEEQMHYQRLMKERILPLLVRVLAVTMNQTIET